MQQINNGFQSKYWIDEKTGEVFEKQGSEIFKVKCDKYKYRLKTVKGITKTISIKPLYKIVFNKNFCIDKIQDLEGEQWKVINKTNNLYQVSNMGRVKSLHGYTAIILKPKNTKLKYDRIDISINGEQTTRTIHSLVAEYFLPKPENINCIIHHKNLNSKDNRAKNLQIMERGEHRRLHQKIKEQEANNGSTEPKNNIY